MKIVAINASPRGMQGNTGRLLDEVLAGVAAAGGQTEVILLKELEVRPCVACDVCHETGHCAIPDDYEGIKDALLACDGFILASPNYIFSVTAQLKALLDRLNGLIHCLALEGKYAALVETSGGGEDQEVLDYLARCVNVLGATAVGGVGSPAAGFRSFPDEAALYARARALGSELCACIRDQRRFPEQDAFHAAFRQRMTGLVDIMQEQWVFERDWWAKKHGGKS